MPGKRSKPPSGEPHTSISKSDPKRDSRENGKTKGSDEGKRRGDFTIAVQTDKPDSRSDPKRTTREKGTTKGAGEGYNEQNFNELNKIFKIYNRLGKNQRMEHHQRKGLRWGGYPSVA